MAIKELESFDAIASDHDLPQNLLEKAAYRRCLALIKTNQYEDAKGLLKTYIQQFPSTNLFASLSSSIKEAEKNVEKKFKRLFCNLNSNNKCKPSPEPSQSLQIENVDSLECSNANLSKLNKVEASNSNPSHFKTKKSTDSFSLQNDIKLKKLEGKSPAKKKMATDRTVKYKTSTTPGGNSSFPENRAVNIQPSNVVTTQEPIFSEPDQIQGTDSHTKECFPIDTKETNDTSSFQNDDHDSASPWIEVTSQRKKRHLKKSTSNDQITSYSSENSFRQQTNKRVYANSNPGIRKNSDSKINPQAKEMHNDFKTSDKGKNLTTPEHISMNRNDDSASKTSSSESVKDQNRGSSKDPDTDRSFRSHSLEITSEGQAQWGKPGDCDADFENYVFQDQPEIPVEKNYHSGFKSKEEDLPSPPPLHEILALIDMGELNRVLHRLFNSKKLYSATSLVESISTHSQEIVYWSKIVSDQFESLLEGILKRLQNFPLIQYFDRTPTKENPNRAPTPIQFSNETSILNFIFSEMHIRFCLIDSFDLNGELTSSISFHSFFEEATYVNSYFHLVSLDTFHQGLCRLFPPYDAYRAESMVKAIVNGLFVRPLTAFYEDPVEKEALIMGYLKELCLLGKLEWYAKSKKCVFKPKIYVRGPEKLNPLYL